MLWNRHLYQVDVENLRVICWLLSPADAGIMQECYSGWLCSLSALMFGAGLLPAAYNDAHFYSTETIYNRHLFSIKVYSRVGSPHRTHTLLAKQKSNGCIYVWIVYNTQLARTANTLFRSKWIVVVRRTLVGGLGVGLAVLCA